MSFNECPSCRIQNLITLVTCLTNEESETADLFLQKEFYDLFALSWIKFGGIHHFTLWKQNEYDSMTHLTMYNV